MKVSVVVRMQDIINHALKTANISLELEQNKTSELLSQNTIKHSGK
jgi:hypothetical protein